MPAARCFQILGLCTLLLAAAFFDLRMAFVVLGVDLLVLAGASVDRWRASRLPLSAVRCWPPLLVQGEPCEVAVEIAATSGRAGGEGSAILLLREGLSPALAEAPLRRRAELTVPGRLRWSYQLVPRRRGAHLLAPLTVRVLGPWGLSWSQRDLLAGDRVLVYPRVRWGGKVGQLLLLAQRRRMGQLAQRTHGLGSEPYALREYLPGDPLAKIHWKATARHGRLVSREDTWERGARLIILLDCARTMASLDVTRSKLDHALAAALALTRVAASRGDQVTVLAFSDRVERTVRVRPGGRTANLAYQALFDLEARLAEPAFDLAVTTALELEPRRAAAVLFTSVVDLAAAELLRESLLRLAGRHRALLINLEDPELQRLGTEDPATPAAAFAQVASLELALANRRLSRHLRRGGIRVVASPADRLALEALESYLALYGGRQAVRK